MFRPNGLIHASEPTLTRAGDRSLSSFGAEPQFLDLGSDSPRPVSIGLRISRARMEDLSDTEIEVRECFFRSLAREGTDPEDPLRLQQPNDALQ